MASSFLAPTYESGLINSPTLGSFLFSPFCRPLPLATLVLLELHRRRHRSRARAGEQWREEEDKEREVAGGPPGRPIYKGELISGRENQGDHGVVISPRNASIFGIQ